MWENSEHAQEPPVAINHSNIPPVCDWWFLTVLDHMGSGESDYLLKAIEWCKKKEVDIINMSIGGYKYDALCEEAILSLPPSVVVVAAAGNCNTKERTSVMYPAHYPRVISVVSVNDKLESSEFNKLWYSTDISAYGEQVASTFPLNSFAVLSGTSMAAAKVVSLIASGLAILKQNQKKWDNKDIERILKETACSPSQTSLDTLMRIVGLRTLTQTKQWVYGAGIADKIRFLNQIGEEYNLK